MNPIIQIVKIDNGYAIYSGGGFYDVRTDGRVFPLVVFTTKEEMLSWINKNWLPKSVSDA